MFFKNLLNKAVNVGKALLIAIGINIKVATGQPATIPAVDTKKIVSLAEADLDHVIEIVNNVKTALSSNVAAILVDIIPSTIDDKIRTALLIALPFIAAGLTYQKNILETSDLRSSASLDVILAPVRFAENADQDAFYHNLAVKLVMVFSDGKITWSEAVMIIETWFRERKAAGLIN